MEPLNGCSYLQELELPTSVTSIGKECFSDCTSLTSFTSSPNITTIPEGTFVGCTDLSEVNLTGNVDKKCETKLMSIRTRAFEGCNLYGINIPKTVKIISPQAFANNRNLKSVIILGNKDDTTIAPNAFGENYDVDVLTIEDTYKTSTTSTGEIADVIAPQPQTPNNTISSLINLIRNRNRGVR